MDDNPTAIALGLGRKQCKINLQKANKLLVESKNLQKFLMVKSKLVSWFFSTATSMRDGSIGLRKWLE